MSRIAISFPSKSTYSYLKGGFSAAAPAAFDFIAGGIFTKSLTKQYSITQFCYWVAVSGGGSFATIYLLDKGVPSGVVGLILALSGLLSCLTQPLLAAAADRSKKLILHRMLMVMAALCCVCFALQFVPALPMALCCITYAIAIWSGGAMVPLMNALSVAYDNTGYTINYGIGRGIGAAATALSSLALGHLMAKLGNTFMLLFVMCGWVLFFLSLLGYPTIAKPAAADARSADSCTIFTFIRRYKWFCLSLLGVLCLGMYHVMTETYLIAIVEPLGGNSSHVGTALFISAIVTFPVVFFFSKIRRIASDTTLLKIAALSYLLKSVCFYFAVNIPSIYIFQLLQTTSYAFLEPTQVYYSKAKVRPGDLVKGQAFITAAYALGGSAGNFVGGQLMTFGVSAILTAGIIIAATGTLLLFITVNRTDSAADPA